MKSLLLLRHAKSSWNDPTLADHDRPLKSRGIKAARRMGRLLTEQRLCPEVVICSTALRARETLQLVLEEANLQPTVEFSERLFHCPTSEFRSLLHQVGSEVTSVLLVGHNPGLEEFLAELTGNTETFPTAALCRLELEISDWSQFHDQTRGSMLDLWRPKDLPDTA